MSDSLPSYTLHEDVMFYDTDLGGVVHNLAYLRMIEACRTKLATEGLGMDLKTMAETNLYPVVLSSAVEYKFPATLGHKLKVIVSLDSVERVKFWVKAEIYAEGVDRVLVTARQSLAMVQMPNAKPQRLPKEWRERWATS
ncbi:acyl-CoA thioesterase [Rubritalea marina]|uniref:acyl-CoA thioesterase n=1 Tax=Rubritalea marina TaxID=361055 RepID=UPI0003760AA7|nr:thioesterase family protein [Rubritalea marina]